MEELSHLIDAVNHETFFFPIPSHNFVKAAYLIPKEDVINQLKTRLPKAILVTILSDILNESLPTFMIFHPHSWSNFHTRLIHDGAVISDKTNKFITNYNEIQYKLNNIQYKH
jgi:hypothetical protein